MTEHTEEDIKKYFGLSKSEYDNDYMPWEEVHRLMIEKFGYKDLNNRLNKLSPIGGKYKIREVKTILGI